MLASFYQLCTQFLVKLIEFKSVNKMANQLLVLISVLSIVAIALAQNSESEPKVIRETNNNDGSGNYLFTYVF